MRRRSPTKAEAKALAERIAKVVRADPDIERKALAERFGCHLNTIRDALKAAGLYVDKSPGAKVR